MKEVERVSKDPVFWVRREAAFALGALAKVVPQELVLCTLVGSVSRDLEFICSFIPSVSYPCLRP